MRKSEKPIFVENLTAELKSASSSVLVDFTGLSVKSQQELKKRLKVVGAKMIVVKNTLFKRAGEEAKIQKGAMEDSVLQGPTALITSEGDPIAPLQIIYKFAKEFEVPQLKVGIVEGNFHGKESLEKLAQLPSREILLGQTVGTIAAPLYGIVGVLQGNIQKLLYILKAKASK